ncbi:MAG: winged helix-turn-helix domain-containing protein [Candidatus Hodarchaeota archaeon]
MDTTQQRFEQIELRLEEISQNLNGLQDLMLYLKSSLESVMQREEEKSYITRLTLKTNKYVSKFLEERSTRCKVWEWCTRRVEKATSLILHSFMEEGSRSAIAQTDYHINSALQYHKNAECVDYTCCDEDCFRNVIETFETLKDLLQTFQESTTFNSRDIVLSSPTRIEQMPVMEVCDLLKPLANESRLKILKELGKGSKNYATIERRVGIKGGHLQFHLNILLKAKYISKEKTYGNYLITRWGLKALRLSFELCESI